MGKGQFNVNSFAAVQTNSSPNWTVDYGDGSAPFLYSGPQLICDGAPPGSAFVHLPTNVHTYAAPGTYKVTVSLMLRQCDGTPGPTATQTINYWWVWGGLVPVLSADQLESNPTAPPSPGWGPMWVTCTGPDSIAAYAQFAITCTIVSHDTTDPISFACTPVENFSGWETAPCNFNPNPPSLQTGTTQGMPTGSITVTIPETMPPGFPGISWQFKVTQASNTLTLQWDAATT